MAVIRVIVESPFKGETVEERMENIKYARAACRDAVMKQEIPMASHLLYPQFLAEENPHERNIGIQSGYVWWDIADKIIFYIDRGMSDGMLEALRKAANEKRVFEFRYLETGVVVKMPEQVMEKKMEEDKPYIPDEETAGTVVPSGVLTIEDLTAPALPEMTHTIPHKVPPRARS